MDGAVVFRGDELAAAAGSTAPRPIANMDSMRRMYFVCILGHLLATPVPRPAPFNARKR
jgi:hypothetical protein